MSRIKAIIWLTASLWLSGCKSVAEPLIERYTSNSPTEYPTYGCSCGNALYFSVLDCRRIPFTSIAALVSEPDVVEKNSKCYATDDHTPYEDCQHSEVVTFKKIRLLRSPYVIDNSSRFLIAYLQETFPGKLPRGLVLKKNTDYLIFIRRRADSLLPLTEFEIEAACERSILQNKLS